MNNHIKLDNYLINYQVFFKKIKHMYLRYEDNMIKITCNKKMTKEAVEIFIIKHKGWILKHHHINKIELYNHEYMYIWGKSYQVKVDDTIKSYIQIENQYILIKDKTFNINKIEKFFKEILLLEIHDLIDNHKDFIESYIPIDKITYKAQLMKTRLGSCIASKRIIKLNSILARLDKKYLKLVLFHELAHLKVSNHSRDFHVLLEKLQPNHRLINKNLKKETISFNY